MRRFVASRMLAAESAVIGAVSISALDWRRFAAVALVVELVIAIALLALSASAVDVMGALASGLIVAYIIHLWMGAARKE